MSVARRDLFRIAGSGLAAASGMAQHRHPTPTTKLGDYEPRVLNAEQYSVLQRLLELLLPGDEKSPSARDAGVGRYLDTVLKYSDDKLKDAWVAGLNAVDNSAKAISGKSFGQSETVVAAGILENMARNETHPSTDLERFFVLFKRAAIDAYYLSDGGRKSLGYRGDTAIASFPGCTHPEHKVASGG